ncbi:hypothetical protein Shyhy01_69100 [Streptomyces hygroscopicus subsp. hygroscopicus]|nr:hypothetical protein Shyhy01_69100 [Streptomyces hygroscopicus subsp. hygroscopicus]
MRSALVDVTVRRRRGPCPERGRPHGVVGAVRAIGEGGAGPAVGDRAGAAPAGGDQAVAVETARTVPVRP